MQAVAESYGARPVMTGANSAAARLFGGTPAERPELAIYASWPTRVQSIVGVPEALWAGIASLGWHCKFLANAAMVQLPPGRPIRELVATRGGPLELAPLVVRRS